MLANFLKGCLIVCAFLALTVPANSQNSPSSPLLIIKINNEGDNLVRMAGISDLSPRELAKLDALLRESFSKTFTLIPESDKRDCIELGIVIEKMRTAQGVLYLGSSAIAVGKGTSDLLVTHNTIAQPTLEKVSASLILQLDMMQVKAMLPK